MYIGQPGRLFGMKTYQSCVPSCPFHDLNVNIEVLKKIFLSEIFLSFMLPFLMEFT